MYFLKTLFLRPLNVRGFQVHIRRVEREIVLSAIEYIEADRTLLHSPLNIYNTCTLIETNNRETDTVLWHWVFTL